MTDSNILKTQVAPEGITQLIERLGRDCTPTQYVREYTQNSIEAIERTGKPGTVLIDANWDLYEAKEVHKLTFIDSGDGMTCDEMRDHLNNLSSSGHADNVFENYGVGAKIASLTRNHAGIIYDSWKNGEGNRIVITYDKDSKSYGILPIQLENGRSIWCSPIDDSQKPNQIDQHGTRATLLGMEMKEDTMSTPPGQKGGKENWLHLYINTRYFRIPEEVTLKVRVGYYRDPENKKHNYLRNILGQEATLDKHTISKGTVSISDANIHWWILDKDRDAGGHSRELVNGHTGCLNQNELFNLAEGRSSKAPQFGIIVGKEDVVMYIEPSNIGYVQNTSRTGLVQTDGSHLPWERWQDEFRIKMPKELEEFIKERMNAISSTSHDESIRERLKTIAKFFKISRYRKSATGTHLADPDSEIVSKTGQPSSKESKAKGGKRKIGGAFAGDLEEILLSGLKEDGVFAEETSPDKFPSVMWCSLADKTRSEDEMDDRAASFLHYENKIKGNVDFQGYQDIIKYYVEQYADMDIEGYESIIKDVVLEAFEQQLIEVVMGALSLKNRSKWNPANFENAVSEEALTTAVMPRYHLMNQIKRKLGSSFGSVKKAKIEI